MDQNHKTEYEDQIALFALGLLTGYELRKIEEHLESGCEVCTGLLEDCEEVFTNLPYALKDEPLSPELEGQIMDKLDEPRVSHSPERKSFLSDFWKGLSPVWLNIGSGVAAAAIIFLLYTTISLQNRLSVQEESMNTLIASLEKEEQVMEFVKNPNVSVVNLESSMPGIACSGRIFWNQGDSNAILIVSNVPELVPGQTYQFWAIEEGVPHSMGTFAVNDSGDSMMEIDYMPKDKDNIEFAVTLEPEGGMPEPTGAKYLFGSL